MTTIHAYAAHEPKGELKPFSYEVGDLKQDEVEIDVIACGVCHSDLSMVDNDWGFSPYPLVPGHEVIGKIAAIGGSVTNVKVGQTVGLGWIARSCQSCQLCLSGDHSLCATKEQTIVGRHGGFADKVRCQSTWAIPLPDGLSAADAGPLFCGGVTVFNAIVQAGVKPTDRVGVVGIGGLGHLALQFLNKWGCEVIAFSSSASKADEARGFGAHRVVDSRSRDELKQLRSHLDMVLTTVNVSLDWNAYLGTLRPRGRLHTVGVIPEPMAIPAFPMISGQKSVAGSPVGGPALTADMLEFCARHDIKPMTEHFPMAEATAAMEHLRQGKARYRVVLDQQV